MTHNYPAMIEDPSTHGFEWLNESVRKDLDGDRKYVEVGGNVPILNVTSIDTFEKSFPGVILSSINGTSIRVKCQGVTRRMVLLDRSVSTTDMQEAVLKSLHGVRTGGTRTTEVYIGPNDERYTSRDEAREAWKAHYEDTGEFADTQDA